MYSQLTIPMLSIGASIVAAAKPISPFLSTKTLLKMSVYIIEELYSKTHVSSKYLFRFKYVSRTFPGVFMAYASSSSKTIFISDRSASTEQVQRHRNPIRALSSVAGNITRKFNWATTSNHQQELYTRNIKKSPLCRLPPPILIYIFHFLDAKDLYTLSRTCHLLKEVVFNHPIHFPCIHPLTSYFYGKTLKEQLHYQTPTFTEKFNGVRWMPTISEQNDIPVRIKAKASQCPLMTATLARYLSNNLYSYH